MARVLGVLALVVSLALGACSSSGGSGASPAGARAAGNGSSPSGSSVAESQGSSSAVAAGGSSKPNTIATFSRPPGATPPPGYSDVFIDTVNVTVPEDESWGGADCAPPRAGSHCTILFRGIAILAKDETGVVLIEAFEDDRPLAKTLFRKDVRKGRTTIYEWVPYVVPPGVHTVVTKVVLQNSNGVPVAESPPQRFYIS